MSFDAGDGLHRHDKGESAHLGLAGRLRRRAEPEPREPARRGRREQLHEWAFALKAWREPHGMEGGEVNASTAVVEESIANVGARSWAGTCSAAGAGRGATIRGAAGGATTRRSTSPCSSSRTTRASRSRCGRHDVHVRDRRHRVGARAGEGGGRRQGRRHRRRRRRRQPVPRGGAASTSSSSTSPRCSSAAARGCSTASARASSSSRCAWSRRRASRTSGTAWLDMQPTGCL